MRMHAIRHGTHRFTIHRSWAVAGLAIAATLGFLVNMGTGKAADDPESPPDEQVKRSPEMYEATVLLQVKNEPSQAALPATNSPEFKAYKRLLAQLARSLDVADAAISRPEIAKLPAIANRPDAAKQILAELRADFPGDSDILRIRLAGEDAETVVRIVNTVAEQFLAAQQGRGTEGDDEIALLKRLYDRHASELANAKRRMQLLAEGLQVTDASNIQAVQRTLLDRVAVLRQQRAQLQTQKLAAEARKLKTAEDIRRAERSSAPDLMVDEQLLRDFSAQSLLKVKQSLEEDYLKLATSAPVDRPSLAAERLKDQLEKINGQLEEKRQQVKLKLKKLQQDELIGQLSADFQAAEAEEKRIQGLLDQVAKDLEEDTTRAKELVSSSADVEALKAQIAQKESIQSELGGRLRLHEASRLSGPRVVLIEKASLPSERLDIRQNP